MSVTGGVDAPGQWCPVAALAKLPDGEILGVEVEGRKIAIYHVDGAVYATGNICTHAYALLSDGWVDDGRVECPLHGGKFDLRTGEAVEGPVHEGLPIYPARVRGDGHIEIAIRGDR